MLGKGGRRKRQRELKDSILEAHFSSSELSIWIKYCALYDKHPKLALHKVAISRFMAAGRCAVGRGDRMSPLAVSFAAPAVNRSNNYATPLGTVYI